MQWLNNEHIIHSTEIVDNIKAARKNCYSRGFVEYVKISFEIQFKEKFGAARTPGALRLRLAADTICKITKIQFAKSKKYNLKDYQNPHLRNNKFTFPKLHKCNLFTVKKYKSQHYKIQCRQTQTTYQSIYICYG